MQRPAHFAAPIALVLAVAISPASAATYFVSATGDDANPGTSAVRPWRTIERVNAVDLEPGDRVRFKGGERFPGTLVLGPEDAGTRRRPVFIGSWWRGRATIDAGTAAGIFVHDAAGIRIRNLKVEGAGRDAGNRADGISFYSDIPIPGHQLDSIWVENVEVSGFGKMGLVLGAWAVAPDGAAIKTGFRRVRFVRVDSHHNADAGIASYGTFATNAVGWSHADVYVGRCRAWSNPGIPGKGANSGNGIVLADVDGGTIERSLAWDNGALNDHRGGGPVGIWAWDANRVVIQRNESWGNRLGRIDGGGFDLDGGCTESVLQDNVSHDNVGSGFLVYQFGGARPMRDNVVRRNRSIGDGRTNGGGLVVGGGAVSTLFEGNVIELGARPAGEPEQPVAVSIVRDGLRNFDTIFRDNEFRTADGVPLVDVPEPGLQVGLLFTGNVYDPGGAPFAIRWGGSTYGSFAAWRAATGQEP